MGETHWGGLAQKARLKADWLIPLPAGFTPRQAMAIGTAGYTAMLSVLALERNGVTPDKGQVLVTGANGGVGSFAIALLARLGYQVAASTGRPQEADYLKRLGASEIIDRASLAEPGRPLGRSAGPVPSTRSAATPWPTSAPASATAARSRPAAWPRAWIFPPASRPSSCVA